MSVNIVSPEILTLINNLLVNLIGLFNDYGAWVFGFVMIFWALWFIIEFLYLIRDYIVKVFK